MVILPAWFPLEIKVSRRSQHTMHDSCQTACLCVSLFIRCGVLDEHTYAGKEQTLRIQPALDTTLNSESISLMISSSQSRRIITVFKGRESIKGQRATSISWYTALLKPSPLRSSTPTFEWTQALTSSRDWVTHTTHSARGGCRGCRGVRGGEELDLARKGSESTRHKNGAHKGKQSRRNKINIFSLEKFREWCSPWDFR